MPWLSFDKPNPTDYAGHGGGSIPSTLLQRRDPYADAIKTIAPAIQAYLKKKRNDEIANQLLDQLNVPAEQRFNGGAEGLQAYQMYQDAMHRKEDRQYQIESRQPDTAMDDLHYLDLWNKTHPDESGDDGMTAYQREQTRLREMDIQRKERNADIPLYSRAIARGRSDGKGGFDNNYEGAENGDMAQIVTPKGETKVVPWDAYQRSQGVEQQSVEPPLPQREQVTMAPKEGPTPEKKQLDPATAKAILAEAGGDKEKARQIARERGFSF